jgi:hypothetical protein
VARSATIFITAGGAGVAHEKILILESTWASESDYISDSRSTARIYLSFESLLSLHDVPVFAVHRPLLAGRYIKDIRQFVSLSANARQMNIVILSAHGTFTRVQKRNKKVNRRRLHAIDGQINLSRDIHDLKGELNRTVFILDACDVGARVDQFRSAAGALGVIGFSQSVDWADSAVFVLALLLHIQGRGIFQESESSTSAIKSLVDELREGPYKSLTDSLGLEVGWAE